MPIFRAVAPLFATLLLTAAADAQNAPDWTTAQSVPVTMADFSFAPNTLTFHANKPYVLHLTNTSGHGHSFDAPEFFAAVTVAPEDRSKIDKGDVEVEGGQSVDVKIVPKASGSYKFHCSHFLHASFGMTGQVVVE